MSKLRGDLVIHWSNSQNDVMFTSTEGPHATDGRRLLYHALSVVKVHNDKSLLDELEERGFDLKTIRFSINRKVTSPS